MGFTQAIQAGFSNYVNFQGRAIRSEFWFWVLFVFIVVFVADLIDLLLFGTGLGRGFSLLGSIASLALLLPGLGVSVRRLHDIDRSGWWLLIVFVPLIGGIVLIVFDVMPGTPGPNRFGPDPMKGAMMM
jgi:uncharacterized membrane protein YhaH (DUF805 family)